MFESCRPDSDFETWQRFAPYNVARQMSDTYFVYVLRSEVTGRRYVGSCANLEDRLHRHNAEESKATKSGAPWRLVYSETFGTRALACQREQFFKTGRGRDFLDRLESANGLTLGDTANLR